MFAVIMLIGVTVGGFLAAVTLGTQAYFRGEMTKPIHQRNWNSSAFERLAQTLTGESINDANRIPGFEVGDAYAAVAKN
ncbi:MAG: hypothetical protein AAGB01_06070 [Cyanobacteria bacterium P01_F01_bin.42]